MSLLDIPLVMSLASWIWSIDTENDDSENLLSPELCVGSLPLLNGDCWKRLFAKGLGMAIIAGACISKLPMIMNMLDSQSAVGLSKAPLRRCDTLCSFHTLWYFTTASIHRVWRKHHPIGTKCGLGWIAMEIQQHAPHGTSYWNWSGPGLRRRHLRSSSS
mmetsp:Transcript_14209/g.39374  ORF Transcript_14209/g.39374 Transcript_14209/m.39374 type:complete len:160 (+) Transcript_14209:81-560(+)